MSSVLCHTSRNARAGTCSKNGVCECWEYFVQQTACRDNYVDVIGPSLWHGLVVAGCVVQGSFIAAYLVRALLRTHVQTRANPVPSVAAPGRENVPGGKPAQAAQGRQRLWRHAAAALACLGSVIRVIFLLIPRHMAGERYIVVLLQLTRRMPQVLWLAAYLCIVVVWHDLTQALHLHVAPNRVLASRRVAELRIQLAVLACLLCVLLAALPLCTMAAFNMYYPATAEAVDAIIALAFLVVSMGALVLALRVARALRCIVTPLTADSAAEQVTPASDTRSNAAVKWPLPRPHALVLLPPAPSAIHVGMPKSWSSPDFLSLRSQATQSRLLAHTPPKPAHAYLTPQVNGGVFGVQAISPVAWGATGAASITQQPFAVAGTAAAQADTTAGSEAPLQPLQAFRSQSMNTRHSSSSRGPLVLSGAGRPQQMPAHADFARAGSAQLASTTNEMPTESFCFVDVPLAPSCSPEQAIASSSDAHTATGQQERQQKHGLHACSSSSGGGSVAFIPSQDSLMMASVQLGNGLLGPWGKHQAQQLSSLQSQQQAPLLAMEQGEPTGMSPPLRWRADTVVDDQGIFAPGGMTVDLEGPRGGECLSTGSANSQGAAGMQQSTTDDAERPSACRVLALTVPLLRSPVPAVRALARVSLSSTLAVCVAGVLAGCMVAIVGWHISSSRSPQQYVGIDYTLHVFVEGGIAAFIALAAW